MNLVMEKKQRTRNIIMFAGVGFIMICMCLGFYCLGITDGFNAALELNPPKNCTSINTDIEGFENWGGYDANINNDDRS